MHFPSSCLYLHLIKIGISSLILYLHLIKIGISSLILYLHLIKIGISSLILYLHLIKIGISSLIASSLFSAAFFFFFSFSFFSLLCFLSCRLLLSFFLSFLPVCSSIFLSRVSVGFALYQLVFLLLSSSAVSTLHFTPSFVFFLCTLYLAIRSFSLYAVYCSVFAKCGRRGSEPADVRDHTGLTE